VSKVPLDIAVATAAASGRNANIPTIAADCARPPITFTVSINPTIETLLQSQLNWPRASKLVQNVIDRKLIYSACFMQAAVANKILSRLLECKKERLSRSATLARSDLDDDNPSSLEATLAAGYPHQPKHAPQGELY
jgi:hypothetical protein